MKQAYRVAAQSTWAAHGTSHEGTCLRISPLTHVGYAESGDNLLCLNSDTLITPTKKLVLVQQHRPTAVLTLER